LFGVRITQTPSAIIIPHLLHKSMRACGIDHF
jgi:hypothetical protein